MPLALVRRPGDDQLFVRFQLAILRRIGLGNHNAGDFRRGNAYGDHVERAIIGGRNALAIGGLNRQRVASGRQRAEHRGIVHASIRSVNRRDGVAVDRHRMRSDAIGAGGAPGDDQLFVRFQLAVLRRIVLGNHDAGDFRRGNAYGDHVERAVVGGRNALAIGGLNRQCVASGRQRAENRGIVYASIRSVNRRDCVAVDRHRMRGDAVGAMRRPR